MVSLSPSHATLIAHLPHITGNHGYFELYTGGGLGKNVKSAKLAASMKIFFRGEKSERCSHTKFYLEQTKIR